MCIRDSIQQMILLFSLLSYFLLSCLLACYVLGVFLGHVLSHKFGLRRLLFRSIGRHRNAVAQACPSRAELRPLTNHAKVWAAHSRPARSHGAVNYRARPLRGGLINSRPTVPQYTMAGLLHPDVCPPDICFPGHLPIWDFCPPDVCPLHTYI